MPGPHGFTWLHIDPSRSTEVLYEFLGEAFSGIIGCDYYSAYRKFLGETDSWKQFCSAHLVRDVKSLTTLGDPVTRRYGQKLLTKIKHLFRLWHRREQMPKEKWERAARRTQEAVVSRARQAPSRSEAQTIANGFATTPRSTSRSSPSQESSRRTTAWNSGCGSWPIDHRITQGTRGEPGRRWCERMWTVLATCVQQGRSVFRFLQESIVAYCFGPCFTIASATRALSRRTTGATTSLRRSPLPALHAPLPGPSSSAHAARNAQHSFVSVNGYQEPASTTGRS